jgi:hypothetical protein
MDRTRERNGSMKRGRFCQNNDVVIAQVLEALNGERLWEQDCLGVGGIWGHVCWFFRDGFRG